MLNCTVFVLLLPGTRYGAQSFFPHLQRHQANEVCFRDATLTSHPPQEGAVMAKVRPGQVLDVLSSNIVSLLAEIVIQLNT